MSESASNTDNGLLHALAMDGQGGGREIGWDEVCGSLDGEPSWIWAHLDFTHPETRRWIQDDSGVNSLAIDPLLDEESRPRVVKSKDGILVILRGLNTNPGAHMEDMVSIRIWLEEDRVISTRRRRLKSVVAVHDAITEKKGPKTPGEFLVLLITCLSERISMALEDLDQAIEVAEGSFSDCRAMDYKGEFSLLRRQCARIRRYLLPQRDALEQLARIDSDYFDNHLKVKLREEANHMTRLIEDLDLIRERAMVAQEELLGQLAQEQNSRMYVLSLVAAIFLPLSFLTGLMGMNVGGLPGLEVSSAFWILSISMGAIALGILGVFKWKKWM